MLSEYWQEVARELLDTKEAPGFHAPGPDADSSRAAWMGAAAAVLAEALRLSGDNTINEVNTRA
jgi:hypothetical protein